EGETFHLYIVEPTTGKEELFTNGVFEDANTILSDHPTMEWKRIDSIEQAMEKEKRKQERRAAREAEKVERSADEREEQEETNEEQEETEADVPVAEADVPVAEEVPLPAPAPPVPEREEPVHVDPLATQRQAAVALQQRIQQEIGESSPNGAYGQYYGEWDALLNDVWQQLQASLSPDAFQALTNEQVHWIAEKERILRENEAVASARAWAIDEVTRMTEQRTFYLLDQLR
ncbi:MAG TPA: lysozyme inhibitor LprI family protein, partial [Savagea sp.]